MYLQLYIQFGLRTVNLNFNAHLYYVYRVCSWGIRVFPLKIHLTLLVGLCQRKSRTLKTGLSVPPPNLIACYNKKKYKPIGTNTLTTIYTAHDCI